MGLYHDIMSIHELYLANDDFKTYLKKVVDYFLHGSSDITKFGAIIGYCIHYYCNLYFENSHVELTQRPANEVLLL